MTNSREYYRAYREANREKIAQQLREYREANREHLTQQKREYYEANREHLTQQKREYYEVNREQIAQRRREHYEANRDTIAQQKCEYRAANKEKIAQWHRKWREANREQLTQQKREYYEANKDQITQQAREYREAHREQIAQQKSEYYEVNREQIAQRKREWAVQNPDKLRQYDQYRRAMENQAFVEAIDRQDLLVMRMGRCGICGGPLAGFHVEHIIPLDRGGLHSYANVALAHPICNQRKSSKVISSVQWPPVPFSRATYLEPEAAEEFLDSLRNHPAYSQIIKRANESPSNDASLSQERGGEDG